MSLVPRMAWPGRRRRPIARSRARVRGCQLVLDHARCTAGDALSGRVLALDDDASVALLRLERLPHDDRVFEVAGARASPPDGTFTLAVPCDALPSTEGEQCRLRYIVCARTADPDVDSAELVVQAKARPHLDCGSARADRLLANWEAAHFHIELSDAQLEGGGRLAGRVHRHGPCPAGTIVVTARCVECWCASGLAAQRMPLWCASPMWERLRHLRIDPDATWAPFEFELPNGLPPAVEASTLAWRYELVAQRSVRHWFDETAALTALLHERERPHARV